MNAWEIALRVGDLVLGGYAAIYGLNKWQEHLRGPTPWVHSFLLQGTWRKVCQVN